MALISLPPLSGCFESFSYSGQSEVRSGTMTTCCVVNGNMDQSGDPGNQWARSIQPKQTGPTRKRGPPQKVDQFFRNFSGWTEPIHLVLNRNFRKFWLNRSRPILHDKTWLFLPSDSLLFARERCLELSSG